MSGRYVYGPRYKYNHMIPEEADIWEKYMSMHPDRFETVDYDFRVGLGVDTSSQPDENYKRMMTALSQKRIDVLAWNDNQPTIIEIKRRVGLSALGQVLGYKILFKNEFKNIKSPFVLVITSKIDRDDMVVMTANNIPVTIVL